MSFDVIMVTSLDVDSGNEYEAGWLATCMSACHQPAA